MRQTIAADQNPLRQKEIYILVLTGLAVLFLARNLGFGSFDLIAMRSANIDVITFGVAGVAASRILQSVPDTAASAATITWALALSTLIVGLSFVPSGVGLGAGFGLLGLLIYRNHAGDQNLKAAAICLFAIASHLTIAPVFFRVFLEPILTLDKYMLGTVFAGLRPDISWTNARFATPDGFGITLVGACSSFAGISVAITVHIGWAMRVRTFLTALDGIAILATAVLATLINITRLVLTGWSQPFYDFWHGTDGAAPGIMLAWTLQTSAILLGGYLSAYWAGRIAR